MLLATAGSVSAQAALAAASVNPNELPPSARLTLRPSPGLETLATKIARVLTLRSHTTVEIGSAPPPGLLEAVSAGNVALALEDGEIHLVMGAALGVSYEARVALSPDGAADTRALALAIEALRDRAIEARERQVEPSLRPLGESEPAQLEQPSAAPAPATAPLPTAAEPAPAALRPPGAAHDRGLVYPAREPSNTALRVKPMLYIGAYGGASTDSSALRTGVSTGGGLCVQGQCLLLAIEYPLPINLEAGGGDVRYRYPTFSCSFYSHPFQFGDFTPAIGVGLLSRVGRFERDMGIVAKQSGLDTDLGLRGSLQGAYEIVDSVDILAELGVDYALDRWAFGNGNTLAYRGSRTSPWLQAGIRIRPQ